MSGAARTLAGAFAYFTAIPLGRFARPEAPDARTLAFLPLVGVVVGALAGAAGWAAWAWLGAAWAFIVAWSVAIALTGALHLDGFLDACDGLLVTASPQRRLEILEDPRHGTFAVAGMAILAAFWLAALSRISPHAYPLVLAFSGAVARLAAIPNAWIFPYGRGGALAATFASRPSVAVAIGSFVGIELLGWRISPWALAVAPLAVGCGLLGGAWASRRLGGSLTGDVYGAVIVVVEVLVLLALGLIVR